MSRFDDPFTTERANLLDAEARAAKSLPGVLSIAQDVVGLDAVASVHSEAARDVGEQIHRVYGLSPDLGRAVLDGALKLLGRNRGEA